MKKQIFAIYDTKAETYGNPIFTPNLAVLTRDLEAELKNPDSRNQLATHAADFELYYLGTFDDQTAELTIHPPHDILNLETLKQKKQTDTLKFNE